jgi:SAM-dependent methyltransferase
MEIHEIVVANDEVEIRRRHAANRNGWNEAATQYATEIDDTVAFLRAGKSNVHPVERQNLGDLRRWCERAVHLQCAAGKDTLSLVNDGVANVVGIDISERMIEMARRISDASEIGARWFCCDVLDAPHELDGWADLVYTGRGALCWLHDLTTWGKTVARLLRPGGVVHVFDDHPSSLMFDPEGSSFAVLPGFNYFSRSEGVRGWPSSYILDASLGDPDSLVEKYVRVWTLADVFCALRGAGLVVEQFGEHRDQYYDPFPNLRPDLRGTMPMTFSMMARRP